MINKTGKHRKKLANTSSNPLIMLKRRYNFF
jgi:hypothetical protein